MHRVGLTHPDECQCRMSAFCCALCWIVICLAYILQCIPHRHVSPDLFCSALSKMCACTALYCESMARHCGDPKQAPLMLSTETSLTSMGVSFAASVLPSAMSSESELSALVACRACDSNSHPLSAVCPLACFPCCRHYREKAESLTAPGRPSTRHRCRSPNRVLRSSSSWWMAWSGRLRMTASSARTHMGSRALSCTTGSLQQ